MNKPDGDDTNATEEPMLTLVEARVLGALMEKQRTTPDYYPLTLNALVQACNQKSSRMPVMNLQPGEVGHTLNLLRERGLINTSFSGRAERYDQKLGKNLQLDQKEQAVLCVLLLRGPQTAGEVRTGASRMAEFDDLAAVHETLDLLMLREPPLVKKVPPTSGRREERYVHLLCGDMELVPEERSAANYTPVSPDRLAVLEQEVEQLRADLDRLWELTGLKGERTDPDE